MYTPNEFIPCVIQATVAYYLMLDNRRRPSNGYLGSEFDEAKVSSSAYVDTFCSLSVALFESMGV